ncbi:MAG: DUF3987 domain-containing protein [Chloroflexota bacterium]|nr:DUF3987 domain-containing protein [Chloroflexota bacterium]
MPPAEDGSKAPLGAWKSYQSIRPSQEQLAAWYGSDRRSGIGFVCGAVSGGLECLEFDDEETHRAFVVAAEAVGLGPLVRRIAEGYEEATPGHGVHWLYRCPETAGNAKLASRPLDGGRVSTLIETRGSGGYVVVAPSGGGVHPTGKPYRLLKGGVATIARITAEERGDLWALARTFDETPTSPPSEPTPGWDGGGVRPGDDFAARADWPTILDPHGWRHVHTRDGVGYWRRPGKARGVSATTNYAGSDLLYVFTSSTAFESFRSYSKFGAYAVLDHAGDFAAAARELGRRGYGQPAAGQGPSHGPSGPAWRTLPPVPPFPVHVLPPRIRTYAEAAAESLGVPVEMVAVPLLGLVAALIGDRLYLALKDDYIERLSLYLAVVADPGAAKTPALKKARYPLDVLQQRAWDAFNAQKAAYDADLDEWEKQPKGTRGEKPAKPTLRRYYSSDLTIEALVEMLQRAPGVAIIRDEILSWIHSLDQYRGGKGADRQQYMELWSSGTIKADRVGRGTIYRPHPVACVVGGVQPDMVAELHDPKGRRDGSVERILPVVPDVPFAELSDASVGPEHYAGLLAVFEALDRLPPADYGANPGRPAGIGVELRPAAKARWVEWYNANKALAFRLRGLAAGFTRKLDAHVARLALVLHALRHPDDPRAMVDAETMGHAIELGEYFRAHIARFLVLLKAEASSPLAGLEARIVRILRKPHRTESDGWATRADLLHELGNVKAEDLSAALTALLGADAVERQARKGATKTSECWRLARDTVPARSNDSTYPPSTGGARLTHEDTSRESSNCSNRPQERSRPSTTETGSTRGTRDPGAVDHEPDAVADAPEALVASDDSACGPVGAPSFLPSAPGPAEAGRSPSQPSWSEHDDPFTRWMNS